jgi:hypothetical protein
MKIDVDVDDVADEAGADLIVKRQMKTNKIAL